jgi:hypothetical protein
VVVRVDLEKPHVVVDVPADDLGRNTLAVAELDVDGARRLGRLRRLALAGRRDDVRVREHVAVLGDDEAGALRRGAHGVLAAEEREDRDHPARALAVDLACVEAVAVEWLGRFAFHPFGGRRAAVRSRHEDGGRAGVAVVDPADRLAEAERGGPAEHGGENDEQDHSRAAHVRSS